MKTTTALLFCVVVSETVALLPLPLAVLDAPTPLEPLKENAPTPKIRPDVDVDTVGVIVPLARAMAVEMSWLRPELWTTSRGVHEPLPGTVPPCVRSLAEVIQSPRAPMATITSLAETEIDDATDEDVPVPTQAAVSSR